MIKFLFKGIIRDKSRSFFPIFVVSVTIALIVFFQGFANGILDGFLRDTAVVATGHMRVMTQAYELENQLLPNDLALLDTENFIIELQDLYPDYFWTPRIIFAGLLDVPDNNGETLEQGPTIAIGIDLFSKESRQKEIWQLENRLIRGRLPNLSNEVLLSDRLANRLNIDLNNNITFIGSTMHNAFTTYNFVVVGTFSLNMGPTDKEMMLVDISGARLALDMENASSAIFGYNKSLYYDDEEVIDICTNFNTNFSDSMEVFSPIMLALRDSNQMGNIVDLNNAAMAIIMSIFLTIIIIVLWNMGLMNSLRRYGEIGMRLAIGESKGQVYRSMVIEAIIIGLIGTTIGTITGLGITYYIQEVGIDNTKAFENINSTSIVMSNIFYAKVTPNLYYIGFIPGVLATVLGTMLAGRAIYKREMAQLFKELEA